MELPGPNWDANTLYIFISYFVSNGKKSKKAFCNTVAVQQPLTLGYMYSVYTSIKLGMFHCSFYNTKVYNFFSIYFNSVKKIYHSHVCKKRKPEKLMFCYLNPSLHSPYV